MLSIRTVVDVVHGILEQNRPTLNEALGLAGSNLKMGSILDYYTDNVEVGMYQLLMINQETEEGEWIAMPNLANMTYRMTIWGAVHHDDPRQRAIAVGALGGAVKFVLNRRHLPTDIGDGYDLYFNDVMPIKRVEYGAMQLSNVFVRGFVAYFESSVALEVRDDRSYPNP